MNLFLLVKSLKIKIEQSMFYIYNNFFKYFSFVKKIKIKYFIRYLKEVIIIKPNTRKTSIIHIKIF